MTVSTNSAPLVGEEYYILDTNTGQGSWISVLTSTLVSPSRYNLTVNAGLYASSVFSSATGLIILKILEESTINDGYAALDLTQDGSVYTFPFNTRKRLGEPKLAGYLLGFGTVEVYRQVYFAGDDGDLGLGIVSMRSFVFRNLTTSQQIVITSGDSNITVPLVVSAGQTFTVAECSAVGVVLPYAVVNSFTV
jgi:hypothetical protein